MIKNIAKSTSIDSFHKGRFYLKQPVKHGHRAGIDAMLLSSLVADNATGKLADLGAGAGAAGLAIASRGNIKVYLVENARIMADLARQSIALIQNKYFAQNCYVLEADVELEGQTRLLAGLPDNNFDHVIMNPPFNETKDRVTTSPLKAKAHRMPDEYLFEKWIKTASAICKPKGQLSLIARPGSLQKILNACNNRFGGLEITNVQPRDNENAIRILLTGIKGSKARISLRSSIILHDNEPTKQNYSPLADNLINGREFWTRKS